MNQLRKRLAPPPLMQLMRKRRRDYLWHNERSPLFDPDTFLFMRTINMSLYVDGREVWIARGPRSVEVWP